MKRKLILIMTVVLTTLTTLTTWSLRAGVNPRVVEVDLSIEDVADPAAEFTPGGGGFVAKDGWKKITLSVSGAGSARLNWNSTKIGVYMAPGGEALSATQEKIWPDTAAMPPELWVKGVDVSDSGPTATTCGPEHICLEALNNGTPYATPYFDRVGFTVVRLDNIWAVKAAPSLRLEIFDPHVPVPCYPMRRDLPGAHLPVFRDDPNYDSLLTALIYPYIDTYDAHVSVIWRKISGPDSGSFDQTDVMHVEYQNPQIGGVYKIGFDFGLGTPESEVNIVLPLAGAEIMTWLGSGRRYVEEWRARHMDETSSLAPSFPVAYEEHMLLTFMRLSAFEFDYIIGPYDASRQAPFSHYATGDFYWYVTLNGVVVHGSKINNMLWALFARGWGWSETEIRGGAHFNEFVRNLRSDGVSSQNAIGLGFELHTRHFEPISNILTVDQVTSLQEPTALIEEKLWPCSDPADPLISRFFRPILSTAP